MDPKRLLATEGVLAATWLVFAGSYGLRAFNILSPNPRAETQSLARHLVTYLIAVLVLLLLVVAVSHLWFGTPTVLSRLLAGLSVVYVPLHLVTTLGLVRGSELHLQLIHFRQPFFPVLTILAVALIIRAVGYRRSPGEANADG